MCEFKVYLKKEGHEETVAEDILYAKKTDGKIILKPILGNQVTVDNAEIIEVDVRAERLILSPIKHQH
jgi:predicted RNA-binding protein